MEKGEDKMDVVEEEMEDEVSVVHPAEELKMDVDAIVELCAASVFAMGNDLM